MSRKLAGALRRHTLPSALLMLLCAAAPAEAHGGGGGGAADSATTLEHGEALFSVNSEYVRSEKFTDAELISFASRHIHAHSADYVMTSTLGLSYGVTDDLTVGLSLPYVRKENIRAGHHSHTGGGVLNTVENHGDSSGWGDATLRGQYRFLENEAAGLEAAVILGLKVPSGKTSDTAGGETLETEFQAGSGSWDPLAGLAVTRHFGSLSVDAGVLYVLATEGAQATDLGDRATGSLGLTWRKGGELHEHRTGSGGHVEHRHAAWDYTLKLDADWTDRKKTAGRVDNNSGGGEMFIGPGVRYTAGSGWSVHATLSLPVANNLRAGHAGDSFKVSTGLSQAF